MRKLQTFIMAITAVFCTTEMLSTELMAQPGRQSSLLVSSVELEKLQDSRGIPLVKLLSELEQKFDATFLFKDEVVINKYVSQRNVKLEKDEDTGRKLSEILNELGLTYNQIDEQTFVLLPKNPVLEKAKLQERISGTVTDAVTGETLPGVNVLVKGTSTGTATNVDGVYELTVESLQDTLVFSFIGYERQEVPINGRTVIDATLQTQAIAGEELVVVAYGMQSKATVTAAISSVESESITRVPSANISSSITGKVPGILSMQASGEPGSDATSLRIRGVGTLGNADPLVVVDGVPRDYNELNPNEIESITVLKDPAAIAPYGMAGANGVIQVTTKRGKEGQISMSYDGWMGFQRPTRYPDYLNAYDYAKLLNTANLNVGSTPPYSDEDLQKFEDGSSPDTHHDHDWIREVVNFSAPMTNHNLTFAGGSDRIRFFSSIGYLYQEGVVDKINYSRYNLAANVDVDATSSTTVSLDIKGRIDNKEEPGATSGNGIHTTITKWPPTEPLSYSEGQPGMELLASIYDSGYERDTGNDFQSQLSIEQIVPVIPGLSLKGLMAYDKGYSHAKNWLTGYTYYNINSQGELVPVVGGVPAPQLSEEFDQNEEITLQAHLNYVNSYKDHHFNVLGVAERRSGVWNNLSAFRRNYGLDFDELSLGSTDKSDFDNSGASGENVQIGLVYRLSYHYDYKYMLELSGRYDGHYYFAPGQRFAFFPAFSVGWSLSEESFIRDNFSWINNLKLRASVGESGNLAGGPFQYLSSYDVSNSYIIDGSQVLGISENSEPNRNITWETARKANVGLEGMLWEGKLGFELDVFWERRSDMLLTPDAVVPVEYGIGISQINAGIMENRGVEFSLTTSQNFKEVNLDAGFNFTYARNKIIETFENESTLSNPNRSRTGKPLDTQFGFRALGLFQTEQEVADHATQFGDVQPGDIKYEDINGDGVINNEDEVVIGHPRFPEIIFGFTTGLAWKGFDVNMHWQGATNASIELRNEAASPFFNGAKAMKRHLDYWTPENPNASNPRLTPQPTTNNSQISSYWMRDGSYLRLKTLDVGYTLPLSVISTTGLRSVRLYLSGQNLLTFSEVDFFDPEMSNPRGRYYFQQKVYSVGINIDF